MTLNDTPRFNRATLAGFTFSIVALALWWSSFVVAVALIGGIASVIGIVQARKFGDRGLVLAIVGTVCGWLAFVIAVLLAVQRSR